MGNNVAVVTPGSFPQWRRRRGVVTLAKDRCRVAHRILGDEHCHLPFDQHVRAQGGERHLPASVVAGGVGGVYLRGLGAVARLDRRGENRRTRLVGEDGGEMTDVGVVSREGVDRAGMGVLAGAGTCAVTWGVREEEAPKEGGGLRTVLGEGL